MHTRAKLAAATLLTIQIAALLAHAGPLDPPSGPVASTYKTLTEVEPRAAINQTNTPGDADSVFRIARPGSYYLTANITGAAGKHGIEIATDGVSIDLMGFELVGVAGSLDGIRVDGPRNNITIRNGVVRDFDGAGVNMRSQQAGSGGLITDLLISGNGGRGCCPNNYSTVRDCVARDNLGEGLVSGSGVAFDSCTAANNGDHGFWVGNDSRVTDCTAIDNGGIGFNVFFYSALSGCVATGNAGDGFFTGGAVTISDCVAGNNDGDGIEAASFSMITNNVCYSNTEAGIRVDGEDSRVESNTCTINARGILVEDPGNLIIRNNCSGNTINYEIVANNRYGPIVDITGGGTPPVSGNSGADTTGTTHPWANFAH